MFDEESLRELQEEAEFARDYRLHEMGDTETAEYWETVAHTYKVLADVCRDMAGEITQEQCIVEQYAGEVAELRAEIDFLKGQFYGKGHASWK